MLLPVRILTLAAGHGHDHGGLVQRVPGGVSLLEQLGEVLVVGDAGGPVEHDDLGLHGERVDGGVEMLDDVVAHGFDADRVGEDHIDP